MTPSHRRQTASVSDHFLQRFLPLFDEVPRRPRRVEDTDVLGIDPDVVIQRGEDFLESDRPFNRRLSQPARAANDLTGPHAAPGEEAGVGRRPVIAACHAIMARDVRRFAADERPRTTRWYRVFNEVPTLLMIAIVILAVVKPF